MSQMLTQGAYQMRDQVQTLIEEGAIKPLDNGVLQAVTDPAE